MNDGLKTPWLVKLRGEFIQLLRRHGADPLLVNDQGVSSMSLARQIA